MAKYRCKTYKAEDKIQSGYIMSDYREYVDMVCDAIGLARIPVKDGRRCRRALFCGATGEEPISIKLPKWARTRKTMLHEIAHYMEFVVFGKTGHGRNFRVCFEGLLSVFMNVDALADYQEGME